MNNNKLEEAAEPKCTCDDSSKQRALCPVCDKERYKTVHDALKSGTKTAASDGVKPSEDAETDENLELYRWWNGSEKLLAELSGIGRGQPIEKYREAFAGVQWREGKAQDANSKLLDVLQNAYQLLNGIKPDALNEKWWSDWDESVLQSILKLQGELSATHLTQSQPVQSGGKWIKASERLPKNDSHVHLLIDGESVRVGMIHEYAPGKLSMWVENGTMEDGGWTVPVEKLNGVLWYDLHSPEQSPSNATSDAVGFADWTKDHNYTQSIRIDHKRKWFTRDYRRTNNGLIVYYTTEELYQLFLTSKEKQ